MGQAATRIGDYSTGHDCHPPTPAQEGSPDTYINGIQANRRGDAWAPHACSGPPHQGNTASGSSTVYINGQQATRIGDPISCGGYSAEGSNNVFIGG